MPQEKQYPVAVGLIVFDPTQRVGKAGPVKGKQVIDFKIKTGTNILKVSVIDDSPAWWLAQHAKKGDLVAVEGHVTAYDLEDGSKGYAMTVGARQALDFGAACLTRAMQAQGTWILEGDSEPATVGPAEPDEDLPDFLR